MAPKRFGGHATGAPSRDRLALPLARWSALNRTARKPDTTGFDGYSTSSVHTLKLSNVFGPNVWVIGTSEASRPCAIRTRQIRGTLFRGSHVWQWPPR